MGVTNPNARAFDTVALDGPEEPIPEGTGPQAAHARLRQAEARLAKFVRADDVSSREAEARFDQAVARSRAAEGPLGGLYKDLEKLIVEHAGGDPRGIADLAQLDQAIGTYRSRLDLVERRRSRGD